MPAVNPLVEEAFEFQLNFVKSGGVPVALSMLTKNNFLPTADLHTRRSAYHVVLKMCKLLLTAVGHAQVQVVADACQVDSQSPPISAQVRVNHFLLISFFSPFFILFIYTDIYSSNVVTI